MRQLRRGGPKAPVAPGAASGGVGTLTAPGPDAPPPAGGRSRRRYDPAWDEWQRQRRWPGILVSCVIILAFLGVVVWHYRPHTAPHHKSHSPGLGLAAEPAFVPGGSGGGAVVTTYHGNHNAVEKFTANGRLVVMHAACSCAYNFVVTISDAFGMPVALPVSNTGTSNATVNQTLPTGRYHLAVVASGPWRIQMIEPTPAMRLIPTSPKPFTYTSTGQSVLGPFSSVNRRLLLQFLSSSNGTIRVYVLNANGVRVVTAFANRNYVPGGVALPNPPSPFFVEVDASSGLWNLTVQHSSRG